VKDEQRQSRIRISVEGMQNPEGNHRKILHMGKEVRAGGTALRKERVITAPAASGERVSGARIVHLYSRPKSSE